jgi:hypothetical protein
MRMLVIRNGVLIDVDMVFPRDQICRGIILAAQPLVKEKCFKINTL